MNCEEEKELGIKSTSKTIVDWELDSSAGLRFHTHHHHHPSQLVNAALLLLLTSRIRALSIDLDVRT
jgi:hypothetical protein